MKNLLKILGIIALVAVIGFTVFGCKNDEEGDGDGDGDDTGGQTGGQTVVETITAVASPSELVGVYFNSSANASGTGNTGKRFEITAAGILEEYNSFTWTITAATATNIIVKRQPYAGAPIVEGSFDYVYDATAKTLVASNITGAGLSTSIFASTFADDGLAYKR